MAISTATVSVAGELAGRPVTVSLTPGSAPEGEELVLDGIRELAEAGEWVGPYETYPGAEASMTDPHGSALAAVEVLGLEGPVRVAGLEEHVDPARSEVPDGATP